MLEGKVGDVRGMTALAGVCKCEGCVAYFVDTERRRKVFERYT